MPALTVENAVRRAQWIAGFFLAYTVVLPFAFYFKRFAPTGSQSIDRTFLIGLYLVSVAEIGIAYFIRRRQPLIRGDIAVRGTNPSAIKKWLSTQIATYAIAVSVAVYGVVLRIMGASETSTEPFYVAAVLMLIYWWPRKR